MTRTRAVVTETSWEIDNSIATEVKLCIKGLTMILTREEASNVQAGLEFWLGVTSNQDDTP